METHSSVLAWRIPWTEEPGRLWSMGGRKELDTTEVTKHTQPSRVFTSCFSCYSGKWNWFNKGQESWEENYKIY